MNHYADDLFRFVKHEKDINIEYGNIEKNGNIEKKELNPGLDHDRAQGVCVYVCGAGCVCGGRGCLCVGGLGVIIIGDAMS